MWKVLKPVTAAAMIWLTVCGLTPSNSTDSATASSSAAQPSAPAVAATGAEIGRVFGIGRYLAVVARDVSDVSKRELAVSEQYKCLAQAVYFEARGEPTLGQLAVAHVVLNRVRDRRYPNTICAVVFQNENRRNRCQFSFACDGRPDRAYNLVAWNRSLKIALKVLAGTGEDITHSATHYHAAYVDPAWASSLTETARFGQHLFYREPTAHPQYASYSAP